jgi:hypothetical protein
MVPALQFPAVAGRAIRSNPRQSENDVQAFATLG